MALAVVTDRRFLEHRPGHHHPERPARLGAVLDGLDVWRDALIPVEAAPADDELVVAVHSAALVEQLIEVDAAGGGRVDPDTAMSHGSLMAARLAAGAGFSAVAALDAGAADAAFCAVRPPGHHATRDESMGFCLFNNVAVTARNLSSAGHRVAIVDIDAHHGNGTQDVFLDDPSVLFLSIHQYPWYPGSGGVDERGTGSGFGATLNVPLPAGAAGDTYRAAVDDIVVAALERFAPDWVLISAGFDAHRDDPLTELGLSAGDYHDIVALVVGASPRGRVVTFLEGGYDLDALRMSATAMAGALLGEVSVTERATSEGPGRAVVDTVAAMVADIPQGP